MFRNILIPAVIGVASISAIATPANAQNFGVYVGSGYPTYDNYGHGPYGYYRAPAYDGERREAWMAHERWEQRRRWESEEARRRYWQHERWEHRGDWHEGDDDER